MKVRRTMTLVTGAAVGASAMWLLDPQNGHARRKRAVVGAWRWLRRRGVDVGAAGPTETSGGRERPSPVVGAGLRTRTLAERAREGFDAARSQQA